MKIDIDTTKTVAPLKTESASGAATASGEKSKPTFLKFKTIDKYSYFESGDKWIKVLLPDLAGLADHPKEKVNIEFTNQRSFKV